jgi:protein involved in sex pheromone biosynthesis
MRQANHIRVAIALSAVLLLSACGASAAHGVNKLLDARDAAISQRNITAYAALIADDYHSQQQGKADIVRQMQQLFAQFSQMKMKSFNRDISIVDSTHARAVQSYRLRVMMGGKWREMLQREELSLTRSPSGWQISSGL